MTPIDFHSLLDTNTIIESRSPVILSGRELEELVSPLSSNEFVNSYFTNKSLYVQGHAHKFDHIFSWEKLRQALARGQKIKDKRYNIMASFACGEASGSARRMMEAHHNQVGELLNAGATICITNIHMADPFLARWAQAIRTQLNFTGTVGVNCYVSADGSGLPMHYDKRVATSIQIAGKKRWRYSINSAKVWPDSNEVYQQGQTNTSVGKLPEEMEFLEVELNPGDLLCLPAGAWHSARGIGHSLALNLYFSPRNFLDQLTPLLQKFATSNEHWRGGPPATLDKTQGETPSAISAYISERIDEFHKMFLGIINLPGALDEPWLNSLTQQPYTGWQPDPYLPIPAVAHNQQFRVVPSSLRFIEISNELVIPCDNEALRFPSYFEPFLSRLISHTASFTIPEILLWQEQPEAHSPNETIHCLQTLYKNGLIKKI